MIPAREVRRPLIGIALSMSAGLGLQCRAGGVPLWMLSVAAFLLAMVCWKPLSSRSTPLIYVLCALLAATYGAIESMPASSRVALAAAEVQFNEQELIGKINDEPMAPNDGEAGAFLFRATAVRFGEDWLPVDAVMRVYLNDPAVCMRFGEQWRLTGRYSGYEKPRGGAEGTLSVSDQRAVRVRPAEKSLLQSCYRFRGKAAKILSRGIEPFTDHIRLLHALLLGYRQSIPPELYQLCARTGVLHIFAISGLHVVVMASILIAGLTFLGIPRPRWGWLLIPALFIYVISTGMKPSALRAFVMASVYFAAPLFGRRPDVPSAVSLAAILLLIMNPANITDPGFLLSFVVVCGLVMVHGWTVRQLGALRSSGWANQLKRFSRSHPFFILSRNLGGLMITSLAAWVFSAPVSAGFFNSLSPAALIANLLVIPLTSMIMFSGCLALLSGMVFLPAAALFNQASWVFINLLIWIIGFFSAIPGGYRAVRMPSAWTTGLWYAGLVLFFTGTARWRKGALALVLVSVLVWRAEYLIPHRDIQVLRDAHSALLLRLPGNRWELVTTGDSFHVRRTIRFVQKEGVNRLHTLVVSGTGADDEAVRQLQETFHPETTRFVCDGQTVWAVDEGIVRISGAPR